jgi:hypothetical protein
MMQNPPSAARLLDPKTSADPDTIAAIFARCKMNFARVDRDAIIAT